MDCHTRKTKIVISFKKRMRVKAMDDIGVVMTPFGDVVIVILVAISNQLTNIFRILKGLHPKFNVYKNVNRLHFFRH